MNARIAKLLAELKPEGITANQAHKFWSCAWETADKLLREMAEKGFVWAAKLPNGSIGYYPSQKDAEAGKAPSQRIYLRPVKHRRNEPAEVQVVIPPHVKIQICPPFEGDYRIRADGSMPAGFVAEWRTLRGQA